METPRLILKRLSIVYFFIFTYIDEIMEGKLHTLSPPQFSCFLQDSELLCDERWVPRRTEMFGLWGLL